MTNKKKWLAGGAIGILALGGAATSVAIASGDSGGGENHGPIIGSAYDRASAAALDHTGGGKVTGTEIGDEESYYEVEVTKADGSQVDVQLDQDFNVVGSEADSDTEADDSQD